MNREDKLNSMIRSIFKGTLPEHPVDMGHVTPPSNTPPEAYTVINGLRYPKECPFP